MGRRSNGGPYFVPFLVGVATVEPQSYICRAMRLMHGGPNPGICTRALEFVIAGVDAQSGLRAVAS